MRAALVLLACASPFALHLAIVSERRAAMIAVFATLAVGALAARMPAWVTAPVALAGIGAAWIDLAVIAQLALAGPMLAFLAAAWLFGRTLLPGRTPLVERISRLERGGDFPAGLVGYARGVDTVLVATGRRPYTTGLGLESLGVARGDRGKILVNERLQAVAEDLPEGTALRASGRSPRASGRSPSTSS